jgi:hypothetical protein
MTLPRAARQLVKLLPIAFVPGRHVVVCCCYLLLLSFDVITGRLDANPLVQVHCILGAATPHLASRQARTA